MTTTPSRTELSSARSPEPTKRNGAIYYTFSDGCDAIQAASDLRAQGWSACASQEGSSEYMVWASLDR